MKHQNLQHIGMGQNELAYMPMQLSSVHIKAAATSRFTLKLSAGVSSDLGKVRTINEDNFLLFHFINEHFDPVLEHHFHKYFDYNSWFCFAVFDGIGGLESGELAAHLAAEVFRDIATGLVSDLTHDEIDYQIRDGFSLANQEVRKLRKDRCGTTGTIVCTNGKQFKVYHIGDCRTYLFRSNNLFQLTRDQTLSEMKMHRGIYNADTPEQKRDSHILTSYIGRAVDFLRPIESQWIPLYSGDKILICSDGLYDMCSDQEMKQIINEGEDIEHTVKSLTTQSLINGGRDNVTCILVGVDRICFRPIIKDKSNTCCFYGGRKY